MTEGERFKTDIAGIWGRWPTAPAMWSYSSLREMEACPRRWMLSRATYPDLWDRRGYPPVPALAALFGNVVHGVVERLGQALADADAEAISPGAAVKALGDLGGWRGIVISEIEYQLAQFKNNPRVSAERIDQVRDELLRRAPQAADQVKIFLRRGGLPPKRRPKTDAEVTPSGVLPKRFPAAPGTHSEREVRAEALRLTGRIDLLIIDDRDATVVDFKTGEHHASHDDQVRLYALLWGLDAASNPARRPATRLEIVYPSHSRSVSPLDEVESSALHASTAARIAAAEAVTTAAEPPANPSRQECQFCQVRHLCDAYWTNIPSAVSTISSEEWFDFEGRAINPQGIRSWNFESEDAAPVLVRTVASNMPFPQGGRVRLLGVRRTIDPDNEDRLVISMVSTSEWYLISS